MMRSRKVLLYSPHFAFPNAQHSPDYRAVPPLPFLAMGEPLRQRGYDPVIVDAKWSPDPDGEVRHHAKDALAIGITCLTGYSVYDGLRAATAAREANPGIRVVWGGWHPSFAAEQAANDPRVDVVVRGQGERTFPDLLDALLVEGSLTTIPGLTFRDAGKIVSTPDRAAEDISHFPPPAYDLVDTSHYVRLGPGRMRHVNTIFSRGCPYVCDFCLDSRNKWSGLPIARIERELRFWVERHDVNHVRFYDGNFFLGRARIEEFCSMMQSSGLAASLEWTATGVAHRMSEMDDDLLARLRKSGCAQVAIGAESGSDELLAQITNKTTVEQTVEAVRRLTRHGINQYLFFMVGLPSEPESALADTLALICRLKAINPAVQLFINFCVPLPGSEMFRIAVEKGYLVPPRSFEEWASFDQQAPSLPNVTREYEKTVRRFESYRGLAYPASGSRLARLDRLGLLWPIRRAAQWRVEHRMFAAPVELALHDVMRVARRTRALTARG
jgi:radical SAM superfamily enzyme YgiQ (UPF0313 family)